MKKLRLLILSIIVLSLSVPMIMAQDIDRNVSPPVSVLENPHTVAPGYEPGAESKTSEPFVWVVEPGYYPAGDGELAVWVEPGYYPASTATATAATAHMPPEDNSLIGTFYPASVGKKTSTAEATIIPDGYWVSIINNDFGQVLQIPAGTKIKTNLQEVGKFLYPVTIPPHGIYRVSINRNAMPGLWSIVDGTKTIAATMVR